MHKIISVSIQLCILFKGEKLRHLTLKKQLMNPKESGVICFGGVSTGKLPIFLSIYTQAYALNSV